MAVKMSTWTAILFDMGTYNAAKNLSNLKSLNIGCGEEDCSKCNDQSETHHDNLAVAVTFRCPSIDEEADNLSDICTIAETSLPAGWNLIGAVGQLDTVFLVELWECVWEGKGLANEFPIALWGDLLAFMVLTEVV